MQAANRMDRLDRLQQSLAHPDMQPDAAYPPEFVPGRGGMPFSGSPYQPPSPASSINSREGVVNRNGGVNGLQPSFFDEIK